MYEAPKNLWIEWMTEISEILRWTNVNTFVRQLTCLEVKTRTKPWWLLRNHWHQKVQTVGEFSKDGPAYLSVWISKFPRRSIKLQQLPTSTRNSRKMKKKKRRVCHFPHEDCQWYKPLQTHPDSFPTSYDQRLPGAHQRYTSHRQRVVWNNAVDAAGSVPPSSLGLHRISSPMFKLLPSNLKTALQDVGRFKPNRWLIDVAVTAAAMLYATQHTPAVVNGVQTVTAGGWAAMQKDIDTFRTMSISLYMVKVRSHA